MSIPILFTKLYIPPPRPKIVLRSRLIERLDESLHCKLTLVSAPAGSGKSTLVSQWAAGRRRPLAWLSLDESDNDPARFLTYLIAALQTIEPEIGADVLGVLESSQLPPTETILTALLNEIATVQDHFVLILDDYHVIDSRPVDDALTFLLEHLPPQMHLVIASREDPHLPLARLRARGQLTELRAVDLRFTPGEAAEFLNQIMHLNLSVESIAALETRTEGWIVGLQLAALSMQGRDDIGHFIQAFTGSHRFVMDYLIEEVLQKQPEEIRRFLLQISILDRLCGSLCDAVSGQNDSKNRLDRLERSNLFIIPLDDQRQWYRYHHLFGEILQTRLLEELPGQASGLHQRASAWYEQNGFPQDAIRHALAGEDFAKAANLLELAWSSMDVSYQSAAWLCWVKMLPDRVLRSRPILNAGYAWALLDAGDLDSCETYLQNAEEWLEKPAEDRIVADQELFKSLPATIATARAYRSMAIGDVPGAVRNAQKALDLAPEGDQIRRIQGTALLGLAQFASGDLDAACQSYNEFQNRLRQSGDIATATGITFVLANIKLAQGRLRQAIQAYQEALHLANRQAKALPVGTADLYRGLAELFCEQGDLKAAAEHLRTAKKLGEHSALTDWQHRLYVAEARIQEAQGNLDEALHLLDEAERRYIRSPLPNIRPIAALRARVWIRQGKLPEVLDWVRDQGLHAEDAISFMREFETITLARLLIARYQQDRADRTFSEAARLLERLQKSAEDGGRIGSLIEILILQSILHQAQGDMPLALAALKRALVLAEPEGYVQLFVSEGQRMAELLIRLKDARTCAEYVQQLLAAMGTQSGFQSSVQDTAHPRPQPMPETLSEREFEVLRLLRTELSGPEIARELVVSLNTLRTHTKNIFSKLGVNNRRAAVRRGEELGLL